MLISYKPIMWTAVCMSLLGAGGPAGLLFIGACYLVFHHYQNKPARYIFGTFLVLAVGLPSLIIFLGLLFIVWIVSQLFGSSAQVKYHNFKERSYTPPANAYSPSNDDKTDVIEGRWSNVR